MQRTATDNAATETAAPSVRYHDLDALRAVAMLLGIVLHGMLAYMDVSIWPAQDRHRDTALYGFFVHAMHGFRLPLFFMLSGFFTAMLWRRRGMGALIKHRAVRIGIPLAVGVPIVWALIIPVAVWGDGVKREVTAMRAASPETETVSIWTAARDGDTEALRRAIENGAPLNGPGGDGITPLCWAAMSDHPEAIALLVEAGADVDAVSADGTAPLHAAAFLGRTDAVRQLIDSGADVNARNRSDETPLNTLDADYGVVVVIAGMLQLTVDEQTVGAGRDACEQMLLDAGGVRAGAGGDALGVLAMIWEVGAMIPVFHHLWFLYYLLMLVAIFAVVASIMAKLGWRVPESLVGSPLRWLWLIPITFAAQYFMTQTFGADTASGLLPWPPKLVYYGVFFAFGALCWDNAAFTERGGRWWPLWLVLAFPTLLVAMHYYEVRGVDFARYHPIYCLAVSLYAWIMIYASIGLFRRFFPKENRHIRYVSDAAYWLYVAHLPPMMAMQVWMSPWDLPHYAKLTLICVAVTAILLVMYEYAVRYTWIGAMLNGRKYREKRATE